MKPVGDMSQSEVAAFVQSHLRQRGIDVALSGGAAVAMYTSGKYVSKDVDLVNRHFADRSAISAAMTEIGFAEAGRHFEHPDTDYVVEFPPGPLAIGDEHITELTEIPFDTGLLRVISPTDCVKDRLAWYFHTGDMQCLHQAILVSKAHTVDLQEIRRWSAKEGKLPQYDTFVKQVTAEP
jgi:hypothetical protein